MGSATATCANLSGIVRNDLFYLLHVLPDQPLVLRISQEIRRVKCGHEFYAAILPETASQSAYRMRSLQQRLSREFSEGAYDFWPYQFYLPLEVLFARQDLCRKRSPVSGRPALQDVRYVDITPLQAHRFYDLGQELRSEEHTSELQSQFHLVC